MEALKEYIERLKESESYTESVIAKQLSILFQRVEKEITAGAHYQQIMNSRRETWRRLDEMKQKFSSLNDAIIAYCEACNHDCQIESMSDSNDYKCSLFEVLKAVKI